MGASAFQDLTTHGAPHAIWQLIVAGLIVLTPALVLWLSESVQEDEMSIPRLEKLGIFHASWQLIIAGLINLNLKSKNLI